MALLRTVIRLNAASCLLFGVLFTAWSAPVSRFLGGTSTVVVVIAGVALLFNGGHLLTASLRRAIRPGEVCYFSTGDLLWVAMTLGIVASRSVLTTTASVVLSLVVAAFVGTLGIVQLGALPEEPAADSSDDHLPQHLNLAGKITASWLSMKRWVKWWLFGVNALFLLAVVLWPTSIARFTLAAYLASGPWLLAIMIHQRGLTRLLGVAHLVPWLPLGAYLVIRLGSDIAGPQLSRTATPAEWWYAAALFTMTAICLAIDVVDVWRWFRGERYRLGSLNAARAGASSLAG